MKNLNQYIQEKYLIDIDITVNNIDNKVNNKYLEFFTKQDVNDIVNWVSRMPIDIQPCIITNIKNDHSILFPNSELYLFYDKDYEKKSIYNLTYIKFYCGDENDLVVQIYDRKQ